MFQGRSLVIATKHHKEQAIAPVLERELGVRCFADTTQDTDELGTFTGEVERRLDPMASAREKCMRAMAANSCTLGVASEGSFGPHPSLPFVPADDELLIFIDTLNHIEVVVRELSTSTNFSARSITQIHELSAFAEQVGFPSHAIILRDKSPHSTVIYKGIHSMDVLLDRFDMLYTTFQSAYAETDMRAMYNPTRMEVIKKAAEKLAQKINSRCPQCNTPGFDITDVIRGLPCSLCHRPTDMIISSVCICSACQYLQVNRYPEQKYTADPMYCNFCNP